MKEEEWTEWEEAGMRYDVHAPTGLKSEEVCDSLQAGLRIAYRERMTDARECVSHARLVRRQNPRKWPTWWLVHSDGLDDVDETADATTDKTTLTAAVTLRDFNFRAANQNRSSKHLVVNLPKHL